MGIASFILVLLFTSMALPSADAPPKADLPKESAQFGDMAAYWVAGRAVLDHENPFDPQTVQRIERQQDLHQAFVIWNPPWILPLVATMALLPFSIAAILWCVANIVLAIVTGLAVSKTSGLSPFATVVATVTFLPVLFCVGMSQWSIFVLSAVVGYDSLRRRKQPFLSGTILAFTAIKPHLVALVWLVPLLTGAKRERIATLAGIAFTLTLLLGITYCWDGRLIPDYIGGLKHPATNAPTNYLAATPAVWMKVTLERWFEMPLHGLQFLPLIIAMLFTSIGLTQREKQDPAAIPVLLLWSALFLPYGWHYDQVLLLPCYLLLWGEVASTSSRYRSLRLALTLILLNGGIGLMAFLGVDESFYFVWPPALVLVWLLENPFQQRVRPKLAFVI